MNHNQHNTKFKINNDDDPGFPKNILLVLFDNFGFLFPEIGTWQFYAAFGFYTYILSFVLFFVKSKIQEWVGTVDDDNLYLTKTKEQQEQERLKRQREAEEILSKYFKVTKVGNDELTQNDEIFNENFHKEKID